MTFIRCELHGSIAQRVIYFLGLSKLIRKQYLEECCIGSRYYSRLRLYRSRNLRPGRTALHSRAPARQSSLSNHMSKANEHMWSDEI